jgi:hypothetical protein
MHVINPSITRFDPATPRTLLYEPTADGEGWVLVGVGYRTPFKPRPPRGFAGPLDSWHNHENRCVLADDLTVVNAESGIDCRLMGGGGFLRQTGWLLHVWLYEDSPYGIFSHYNPNVDGEPDSTVPLVSTSQLIPAE